MKKKAVPGKLAPGEVGRIMFLPPQVASGIQA